MSLVPSLLQAIVHVDGEALVMHAGDKPYVVSPTGQVDLASRGLALDAVNGIVNQLLPTELQHALDEFGAVQYELPAVTEFPGEHFTIVAARGGDDLWVEIRRRRIPDEDQVPEDFFPPREVAAAAQPYPVYASAGSPQLRAAVEPSSDSLELDPDAEMFDSSATAGDGSVREAVAHASAAHQAVAAHEPAAHEAPAYETRHETIAAHAAHEAVAHEPAAGHPTHAAVAHDTSAAHEVVAHEAFVSHAAHETADVAQPHAAAETGWSDRAESPSAPVVMSAAPPPATPIAPPLASADTHVHEAVRAAEPIVARAHEPSHLTPPPVASQPVAAPELAAPRASFVVPSPAPPAPAAAHAPELVVAPAAHVPVIAPAARETHEPIAVAPPAASTPAGYDPAVAHASEPIAAVPPPAAIVAPSVTPSLSANAPSSAPPADAIAASTSAAGTAAADPEPASAPEPMVARVSGFAPKPITLPAIASESAPREPFAKPEPIAIAPPAQTFAAPSTLSHEPTVASEPALAGAPVAATVEPAPARTSFAPSPVVRPAVAHEPVASAAPIPSPLAEPVIVRAAAPEPTAVAAAEPPVPAAAVVTATTSAAVSPEPAEPDDAAEYVVVPEPIAAREPIAPIAAREPIASIAAREPIEPVAAREPIVAREPERVRIVPQHEMPAAAATSEPAPARAPIAIAPPQPAVVLPLSRNPIRPEQQPLPTLGDDPTMSGLDRLLRVSAARGASTLYLSSGSRPAVRVDGELQTLDGEPVLAARDVESLLLTLMPERNHEALRTGAATEWICDIEDVGRVRCMSFRDHRGPGGVFRLMPTRSVSADQLGLPKAVQSLAIEPEGLVLVAGPRSSGKRTLMSAFVDLINRSRRDHVITIEREINIVHERGSSFISQREVRGNDDDLLAAARAALREDPDVLMIEDLRTAGLMNVALEAASSGHLVVGGFAAHSATAAVDRIIDLYAPEHRRQVQFALADSLRGVIVQVLLKKRGGGRVAGREVLLNTAAVSSVIAEGKTSQLPMAIEGGRRYGMMPLNDALIGLIQQGTVDARDAYRFASDRPGLLAALKRYGLDTSFAERLA